MKSPPRRENRWQFSLGSLMLFVTLFAVLIECAGRNDSHPGGRKTRHAACVPDYGLAAPMGMVISSASSWP